MTNLHQSFKLILIRHGESLANLDSHLIGGRSPKTKLSKKGETQAANLGKYFLKTGQKLDLIYSSPLIRCDQTAKICLENCQPDLVSKIKFDDRLIEFSQGDFEGKPRKEVYTLENQNLINKQKTWFRPPSGESLRMLKNRATDFLETEIMNKFWQNKLGNNLENESENEFEILEILEKTKQQENSESENSGQQTIAIFCHGMWIKVLLMEILGLDENICVNLQIDNCSLTELEFGDFGWRLCRFNQVLEEF